MRRKPKSIFFPVEDSPARRKLNFEEDIRERRRAQDTERETASETEEAFPNLRK